jgi:hypothetical protein
MCTRPHPDVKLATANIANGPFTAMLDRAQDAPKGHRVARIGLAGGGSQC